MMESQEIEGRGGNGSMAAILNYIADGILSRWSLLKDYRLPDYMSHEDETLRREINIF